MINVKNIGYHIREKALVDDLSTTLEPQKLHIILGANGAGKSTLIKLLSGQLKPSTGHVWYADTDLQHYKTHELAKVRAVLSQCVDFAFPLAVHQVVMMGRYPHFSGTPQKRDRDIVEEAMALFAIRDFRNRDYNTLSGGEKQRVHFARIMSQIWPEDSQPRYLFLDEPLTYLDVKHQYDFLHLVKDWIAKHPICTVGVLHDLNLGVRFADSLLLMHQSRLLAHGQPETVLNSEHIQQMYAMPPRFIEGKKGRYIEF